MHFETQFWEMLQWYFILCFSRDHVLTMLHLAPIFFFWGGGSWAFWGGSFYPSNILDGTLLTTKVANAEIFALGPHLRKRQGLSKRHYWPVK